MKTPDTRDRALETVLRTRVASGPASADCLDAETLAAWVDHGLDEPSLRRAEAHMADCARCQALLATLVSSVPEPAPAVTGGEMPSESWWSFDIRWLMPLAGAATAVLLWMVVPGNGPDKRRASEETAPAQAELRQAPSAPAEAVTAAPPAYLAAGKLSESAEQKAARTEPAAAAEQDRASGRAATMAGQSNEVANQKAVVDPLAKTETRDAPEVSGRTAAAPAPPPAAPAAEASAQPSTQAVARAPLAGTAGAVVADSSVLGSRSNRGSGVIDSRDPAVRWRLAGAGVVERSLDAGASWERLETGVSASLTAGSAPSASVCWLVGGNGVVLLTMDARTWRRLSIPTSEDLVSVEAVGERTATVRTASGQSFQTTDAGVNWTRVP